MTEKNVGGIAGERLRSFIERIERLEEEKRALAADIAEIYSEAKGNGFDPKTMREIVKLRRMDVSAREEFEALVDLYKAALGMLSGTPLGEAAIRRLSKKPEPENEDHPPEPALPEMPPSFDTGPSIDEARDEGRAAARDGRPVTSNPFTARDPRRAAWDEGWCMEAGSDGMDIPPAWRRSKKPKPGDGKGAAPK